MVRVLATPLAPSPMFFRQCLWQWWALARSQQFARELASSGRSNAKSYDLRRKVPGRCFYPTIIIVVIIIIAILMMIFGANITSLFKELNAELPFEYTNCNFY